MNSEEYVASKNSEDKELLYYIQDIMAIKLKVSIAPSVIFAVLKKKIDNKEIDTWEYDEDGDFTHSASQWKNKAWFTPICKDDILEFGILGRKETKMTMMEYSVYHGRFSEMLLNYFSNYIVSCELKTPYTSNIDTDEIE